MKHILTILLLSITILSFGQTIMNIYQNNGTTVNLPVSTIDSVNFTTTPPPSRMNIYQMGGGIISIVIANIDSITYTVQGASGLAVLSTSPVTNINSTSAVSGGNVASDGGSPITQRGVVWSTTPNPTTANNNTIDGSGTGSFSSTLTGLTANTSYYVRAYSINANGTAYGNELSFTTLNSTSIPILFTDSITFDSTSAVSGGYIGDNGGSPVTQRGVVWNTSQNPTLASNLGSTNDGIGTGWFTSSLTGLTAITTYYVRAYAVNSAGTAYGNELSFTTNAGYGIVTNPGAGVTFDGYTYSSIVLGNGQEWMVENLRTTTYANGDPIPNVTDSTQWQNLTTGAWCHNNNDSQYENPFGKLYNWYTVNDSRNVCPAGWHVPTDAEWSTFINYLDPNAAGGNSSFNNAGGKMKSTGTQYWQSPNTDATNESGFSGLPGGARYSYGFDYIGNNGYWWSSTEGGSTYTAFFRGLSYGVGYVIRYYNSKPGGYSVRCLKD